MPKKKRKSYRKKKTMPVATITPMAVQGLTLFNLVKDQKYRTAIAEITGYDIVEKGWNPIRMVGFWGPIAIGAGISMAASKLGINRKLAQMGVPLIRI